MSRAYTLKWLTNIPTPYRNHRYEMMAEVFPAYGINIEVLYMGWTEKGRHWVFSSDDLRYPARVFDGLHLSIRGTTLHANPRLLRYLRSETPDILVVGGFSDPTTLAAPLVTKASSIRLLGSESNLDSGRRHGWLASAVKRWAVQKYDGYIVPGGPSLEYLQVIEPESASRPHFIFPNLVDCSFFDASVDGLDTRVIETRERIGVSETEHLWLIVARLEPQKGLEEFLPLLKGLVGVHVVIAGEGQLRDRLQSLIDRDSLPVTLGGQSNAHQLRDLYASADLFILPSLRDPSPLASIEAAAMGLPLLLSTRAGNTPDLLKSGQNGWEYDPSQPIAAMTDLQRISSLERAELNRVGAVSRQTYLEAFDSRYHLERLARELIELLEARASRQK